MLYSIIADQYAFADLSSSLFNFVQNFAITPIQFSATTLSELPVLYYFSTTIPNGLSFSSSGRLSGTFVGTETSGSMVIYASTGYTTGSNVYPYTVRPDSMILFSSSNGYTVQAGATLPDVLITGVTYSGLSVSNYQFSNLNPDYGLVLNSNTGVLNGVLTDSVPPNDVLPPSSNFAITGSARELTGSGEYDNVKCICDAIVCCPKQGIEWRSKRVHDFGIRQQPFAVAKQCSDDSVQWICIYRYLRIPSVGACASEHWI
jgi:hypothetical protein